MHYHTIIIGAGPAGLFAAQELGKQNQKVLVLEKNQEAGRKLLVSGGAQCNFTHSGSVTDFFDRYGEHGKFIKKALLTFTNEDTIHFFDNEGVATYVREENNKVFPKSHKSADIRGALLQSCKKHNVLIKYNQTVKMIKVYDGIFTLETEAGDRYFSDNVIIATGGKSFPHLGCTGDGYVLASSLGHTIVEPRPALTYVTTHERNFCELSGISFKNAQITLWHEKKKITERIGSLLFTHKGLSGPVILDATRWIVPGDQITVNYLYPLSYEEARKRFAEEIPVRGKESVVNYLKNYNLPRSFCEVVCESIGVLPEQSCARLSKKEREDLVSKLTKCEFNLSGTGGMNSAMVTAGGITLKEVNPTTMESRKQKGLYFAGEVLDIDGDTGGYNIQAAFSMGYLCAKSITKNKK
ncbi:BaiN/RdsA family NAD(P)/FAD-dependent oxidoreductase [Zhenhengia yiwuensis]|uniref:NAD(P)/FAD-dependent oxidoreductase n=1 Tax=Zhenhengia yiwuensis TaxID=2763666 RepID=A0A926IFC8_9FIRM|nr:NAD(P)/FAD-dependent oxidoreductase [Zhenhengia yiwuensis]MBC8580899.1 NAD(P)/FAD-dependent oxidoreductase [Zhenhengia yiwuensis]